MRQGATWVDGCADLLMCFARAWGGCTAALAPAWHHTLRPPPCHPLRMPSLPVPDKERQRGIIIGKAGSALKALGAASRAEIEEFLGRPVYLSLSVKARGRGVVGDGSCWVGRVPLVGRAKRVLGSSERVAGPQPGT